MSLIATQTAAKELDSNTPETANAWRPPHYKSALSDDGLDKFILGRSFFTIPWVSAPSSTTSRDGLGPLFNANTCASCHIGKLNTKLDWNNQRLPRSLVFKLSQPSLHSKVGNRMLMPDPNYGNQVAINGIKGVPSEAKATVKLHKKMVTLKGGESVELIRPEPVLLNLNYGKLDPLTKVSIRQAPALLNLGKVERIPEKLILANEDPKDQNKDGISGRANWVFDLASKKIKLGKFGHKASQHSLLSQTADAASNDMGLTNALHPLDACQKTQTACLNAPKGRGLSVDDFELTTKRLNAITFFTYNQMAKSTHKQAVKNHPEGAKLFRELKCQSCHTSEFDTIDKRKTYPYSDFLLHDMGPDLADGRREFLATMQEWRTAPLWQMRLKVKEQTNLLHDARARNVQEAILWHGGEAKYSKEQFMQLPKPKRQALIEFLEAL